ncbi:hypothetical protein L1887_62676 [Cichorium endivia]|nr:hypothetical protein L1887_62676 [Cichorium endivia]
MAWLLWPDPRCVPLELGCRLRGRKPASSEQQSGKVGSVRQMQRRRLERCGEPRRDGSPGGGGGVEGDVPVAPSRTTTMREPNGGRGLEESAIDDERADGGMGQGAPA